MTSRETGIGSWWARQTATPAAKKRAALIAGGALICLILIGVVWVALSAVPLEKSAATARVVSDRAPVFGRADGHSRVGTASARDTIDILRPPRARGQEWVAVQVIHNKKPLRPGYMRTSDLSGWDSSSPDIKLGLIVLFQGTGSDPDQQIQAELTALDQFAQAHPGVRAGREARLDMAELMLAQLRRQQDNGAAVSISQLDPVRGYLTEARQEGSLSGRINDTQQKLDQLAAELSAESGKKSQPPPTPHPPPPPIKRVDPKQQVKNYLDKADEAWKNQDFDKAEDLVKHAARLKNDDPDVIRWQDTIQKRKLLLQK